MPDQGHARILGEARCRIPSESGGDLRGAGRKRPRPRHRRLQALEPEHRVPHAMAAPGPQRQALAGRRVVDPVRTAADGCRAVAATRRQHVAGPEEVQQVGHRMLQVDPHDRAGDRCYPRVGQILSPYRRGAQGRPHVGARHAGDRPRDGLGIGRGAVVAADIGAQFEGPAAGVVGHRPALGQGRLPAAVRAAPHQGLVDGLQDRQLAGIVGAVVRVDEIDALLDDDPAGDGPGGQRFAPQTCL